MTNEERKAALEAIIYAADEPATLEQLASALGEEKLAVQASLDELIAGYANDERGIEVRAVAGGYKMYTKPQHHEVVRRFIKSLRPPLRLSMPALETLAVIAYKQPVTAPEISEIRGVNTSGVINTLLEKKLITTAGRKEVMGRPILYKSSKEFEALAREALGADEGVIDTPQEPLSEAAVIAASGGLEPLAEKLAEAEVLREEEVTATGEGMPSGQLDEDPPAAETVTEAVAESEGLLTAEEPKADAKAAGE